MKTHVGHMVAQRIQRPQVILHPKTGVRQRVVLLRCAQLKPDSSQPIQRTQRLVAGHVTIVIPKKLTMQRGKISEKDEQNKQSALPQPG